MSAARLPPEFAGFFEHARNARLAFPRCGGCGRFHWYPMPICPHCQGHDLGWQPVSGRGEISSVTSVHHAFDPRRRDRLPYVVALVTFEDAPGVQLISNVIDAPGEDIAIGRAVQAVFPPPEADGAAVVFRLADGSGSAPQ